MTSQSGIKFGFSSATLISHCGGLILKDGIDNTRTAPQTIRARCCASMTRTGNVCDTQSRGGTVFGSRSAPLNCSRLLRLLTFLAARLLGIYAIDCIDDVNAEEPKQTAPSALL